MDISEEMTQDNSISEVKKDSASLKIGEKQLLEANQILQKYKAGKENLEKKIIENENWWKLRHWEQMRKEKFTPATGWLWNVIVSKHADMEDGFPEPNILPREEGDKEEAQTLSSVVPVVLEQNEFHQTYSDCCWYKLKQGAAIYGIFWDKDKLNKLGDISVRKIDAINLFWEPGITDIQKSRNLFHVELVDNDILKQRYPQLANMTLSSDEKLAKYSYDDTVDTSNKSAVIDWYYHTEYNGKRQLQYVKYVGTTLLYATENETQPIQAPVKDQNGQQMLDITGAPVMQDIAPAMAETGWYAHGQYPFVIDSLFDIEGSPFGYGYTDICKDTQTTIDQLNDAIVRNALAASKKRYLVSDSTTVNAEEFADWTKDFINVQGQLGEEQIREMSVNPINSIYVNILNNQIEMLKETSGNRDVNNGGSQSGVTAASALAVLQEAGNKGSRDMISTTYVAYKQIIVQVIELIRQFYDTPRKFRIIGERGLPDFQAYSNAGIKPQDQGNDFGVDMGYRVPYFDIEVSAQKANPYNKMSQNELALQFFKLQFFNPQTVDQAVACLDMMDFDGKAEMIEKLQMNGTLQQKLMMYQGLALQLAAKYEPQMVQGLAASMQQGGVSPINASAVGNVPQTDSAGNITQKEHPVVANMRERMRNSTQPN